MMKFDSDKEIVDEVKKDTNYEIRTTSSDILRKFNASKAEKVKQRKNKKLFVGIFSGVGLVAASIVIGSVIAFGNGRKTDTNVDGGGGNNPLIPSVTIKNEVIKSELSTFSGLSFNENSKSINSLKILKKYADSDTLTTSVFQKICTTYNDYESNLIELNKEVEIDAESNVYTLNNTSYKYLNSFKYQGESEYFGKMYFNDEKLIEEEIDETVTEISALYVDNDGDLYNLRFIKEEETEGNEVEKTYTSLFEKIDDSSYIYKIEREYEFEGKEIENAYSYSIYNKNVDPIANEDNFIFKLTYSVEVDASKNEEIEFEIESQNEEYSYENVVTSGNKVSFEASYESGNVEVENLNIILTKGEDKNTYTSGEFSYII